MVIFPALSLRLGYASAAVGAQRFADQAPLRPQEPHCLASHDRLPRLAFWANASTVASVEVAEATARERPATTCAALRCGCTAARLGGNQEPNVLVRADVDHQHVAPLAFGLGCFGMISLKT